MDNLYLIKFGGNAIREKGDMERLSAEIADLSKKGAAIVLVHGGGPEISEEMERRGMEPEKVCGLRITGPDVLDVTESVLIDLNSRVVHCLMDCDVVAVGIPGYLCTTCTRKEPIEVLQDGVSRKVDLGLVGEVSASDPTKLLELLENGIIPVVYPIGMDAEGWILNVNADTMAAGIASGLDCKEMITITDVPGIMTDVSDPASKLNHVTLDEIDGMIADGTISGGMIPKVEACRKALLSGVSVVRMVNGKDERSIVSDIMNNVLHGTTITR